MVVTDGIDLAGVHLPTVAVTRLDEIVEREGGTRAEVASRLLVKALAEFDHTEMTRHQAYSFLDLDEDLAGP